MTAGHSGTCLQFQHIGGRSVLVQGQPELHRDNLSQEKKGYMTSNRKMLIE